MVIGRHAVQELLRVQSERIEHVYVVEGVEQASQRAKQLVSDLEQARVLVEMVPREELDRLCGTDSHQSFAAVVQAREQQSLSTFIDAFPADGRCLFVMLDSVFDPHNLGAVLRASECFGAHGVLYSRNRGAGLTAVVSKASAGASEIVPIIPVGNLVQTARELKEKGFWIVGAAVTEAKSLDDFEFPERTVLVLGSEGEGIQPLLQKQCDFIVEIPMVGQIDSLNVSQAAAVLLYAWRSRM